MTRDALRTAANALGAVILLATVAVVVVVAVPGVVGAESSYVVLSDSMSPTIQAGDVVVVRDVDAATLREGDVVTFQSAREGGPDRVTHRIVEVVEGDDGRAFRTKGDANEEADSGLVVPSQVVGRVWFTLPLVGHLVTFAGTDAGLVAFVIVPSALLVVTELYSLYRDATEDRGGGNRLR
jgi:signal peptidase